MLRFTFGAKLVKSTQKRRMKPYNNSQIIHIGDQAMCVHYMSQCDVDPM